jgi:hypothetical protein
MTGRTFMIGWKRTAMAASVAYVMALQALLFSLGGALHAGAANLPQAILCASDSGSAPDHSPAQAHDALCCILSCHGSGSPGGPLPDAASLDRLPPVTMATGLPHRTPFLRLASNVLPVGSRAPPRLG